MVKVLGPVALPVTLVALAAASVAGAAPTAAGHGPAPAPARLTAAPQTPTAARTAHPLATGTALQSVMFAWGANDDGQLGRGNLVDTATPDRVLVPTDVTFTSMAEGATSALGIDTSGNVYGWGDNTFGEIGNGNTVDSTNPTSVDAPPGTTFTQVSAGSADSFALSSTGVLYGWGLNSQGQLGTGGTTDVDVPTPVDMPAGVKVTAVSAGAFDTMALTSDGTVYTWGSNTFGELGDGTLTSDPTPAPVQAPPGVTFTAVSAGGSFDLALTSTGQVYAWGDNDDGQLGNGGNRLSSAPTPIDAPAGTAFTQIAAGGANGLALTTTGGAYSWGDNDLGQLGQGGIVNSFSPLPVVLPYLQTFVAVASGYASGYALSSTGTEWAWGSDFYGQLGDSQQVNEVDPVRVLQPAGTGAAAIYAGSSASSAGLLTGIDQTIDFPPIPTETFGTRPFQPGATTTSGLPLSYSASGSCSYPGSQVIILGAGTCTLIASQDGSDVYNPALPVLVSFTIRPVGLTLAANPVIGTAGHVPPLTYTLSGFVEGNTANALSGTADCTAGVTDASPPGRYPITCTAGTLYSPNYYVAATVPSSLLLTAADLGYEMVGRDGSVYAEAPRGTGQPGVAWVGGANAHPLNAPIVGAAFTLDHRGYWLVAADGGIFSFGDARYHGSTGAIRLNRPIVGMAVTPTGHGYWLVASDGGIFSFGDARYYGSTGAIRLNQPIVAMAPTVTGHGYWLVGADGGIFSFGDARYYGSTAAAHLNQAVVGIAAYPYGGGYWLVTSGGDVFPFGDAPFEGSLAYLHPAQPIVGIIPSPDGLGYTLAGTDGAVYDFGDAQFYGSLVGAAHAPITAII